MDKPAWKKPFLCRVGLHDWRGVPQDQRCTVQNNQHAVQVICSRCGRRKFEAVWLGHDRGGPV